MNLTDFNSAFFDAALAESVTFKPFVGVNIVIYGVFEKVGTTTNADGGAIENYNATLLINSADVPTIDEDDIFEIAGIEYNVVRVLTDGHGVTRLWLSSESLKDY